MGNAKLIKQLAKDRGVTISSLCMACGKSVSWLNALSKTDGSVDWKYLETIAGLLGVPVSALQEHPAEEGIKKEVPQNLAALHEIWGQLTPENQTAALALLKLLADKK